MDPQETTDPPFESFEWDDLEDHADDKVVALYFAICTAIHAAIEAEKAAMDTKDDDPPVGPARRFMTIRNRLVRERDGLKPLVTQRLAALTGPK